ncbi:MAG: membrane protein insertion efficiency factor YidD [Saprospiraceae bacterium]|nr:membrane protein insertion efficiency factor YidD [Saprospiraceae bacterium]MDW8228815.1 membrane protein insertion efficiency factor YidD [Saprospiraceae bacterium]
MPPIQKWLRRLFVLPIRLYRLLLSPLLGPSKCRFRPTCSQYAIEAIEEWGIFKGTWLAIRRIARCHPWGGFGYDPVPKKKSEK